MEAIRCGSTTLPRQAPLTHPQLYVLTTHPGDVLHIPPHVGFMAMTHQGPQVLYELKSVFQSEARREGVGSNLSNAYLSWVHWMHAAGALLRRLLSMEEETRRSSCGNNLDNKSSSLLFRDVAVSRQKHCCSIDDSQILIPTEFDADMLDVLEGEIRKEGRGGGMNENSGISEEYKDINMERRKSERA